MDGFWGSSIDDFGWATVQLARYTYKPGWHLSIVEHQNFVAVRIEFGAPNSRAPGDTTVTGTFPLSSMRYEEHNRNEELFARDLMRIIWRAEQHESQEWLRRDGEILDDPHK